MKKFTFLCAICTVFLTACSSQNSNDPNELSPGIMQPVNGSGASEGSFGWADEIQSAPMPATMK